MERQDTKIVKTYRNGPHMSWNKVLRLMRPKLTSTNVMKRPKCGGGNNLLMIHGVWWKHGAFS